MATNKYKKLLSDTVLFSVSNFGSKVLVFLLVPLYTNVLSTVEYGIVDLMLTLTNLLMPVLTLCVAEAALRFAFDKNVAKHHITSIAVALIVISTVIIYLCKPIAARFSPELAQYWGYFIAIYVMFCANHFFSNYTRGLDKTKLFAIKGLVYTLSLIVFNILFLLVFKMGLKGYIYSLLITEAVCIAVMVFGGKYLSTLFKFTFNKKLFAQMVMYGVPMIPSVVAWWIMQMSGKYTIIAYLGLAANGIFSVAYKIPSILSTFTNIFTQAWQISAIKSYGDDDNNSFVENIYKYFIIISIALCSVLILLSKVMGYVLYAKDYFIAWTYVPMLLVAYHFSGLSGVLASVYSAAKKTGMLFVSTSVGAVLNIVFNIVLIPRIGVMGAAYSTCISFFVTWIIRMIHVRKFVKFEMNYVKYAFSFVLLFVEAWIVSNDFGFMYIASLIIMVVQLIIFIPELKYIKDMLTKGLMARKAKK